MLGRGNEGYVVDENEIRGAKKKEIKAKRV